MKFEELMNDLKTSAAPAIIEVKTDYDEGKRKYYTKGVRDTVKIIREGATESFSRGDISDKTLSSFMAAAEGIARAINEVFEN